MAGQLCNWKVPGTDKDPPTLNLLLVQLKYYHLNIRCINQTLITLDSKTLFLVGIPPTITLNYQ